MKSYVALMSMASWLLAAFAPEIAGYVGDSGVECMAHTCRLLYTSCYSPQSAGSVGLYVLNRQRLRGDFQGILQTADRSTPRGRKQRRQRLRLTDDQCDVFVRDLVLVGLGVRPSCLVDVCRLEEDQVSVMLDAFSTDETWISFGLHRIKAVQFAGNTFFINLRSFVRLKCLDIVSNLTNVMLIDASTTLKTPSTMVPSAITISLCDTLQSLVQMVFSTPHRAVRFSTTGVSSSALAGLVLGYPAVYVVNQHDTNVDPEWTTNDNCLGMCPLQLFMTSITLEECSLPLQEFSIPESLLTPHKAQHIVQRYTRSVGMDAALPGSLHVDVVPRVLAHVAL